MCSCEAKAQLYEGCITPSKADAGVLRSRSDLVEQDVLAALDGLLWLRTGDAVAERLGISQSSVSRVASRCLRLFGIRSQA